MAYNLSMELNLQGPSSSNIAAVRKRIEAGLSNIRVGNIDSKSLSKVTSDIQKVEKQMQSGEKRAKSFFDRIEGKGRDFAAYTIASAAIIRITGAISNATREAIKFESELLKLTQVTGDGVGSIKQYAGELSKISVKYNVTLTQAAKLTRTLTQTGLSFKEAAKGAEILARTSLLATFDSLDNTTEGLIATMQTFNTTVNTAGSVLESINAVSKQFAVESSDLVEAIRRTGGAFSSAGGQVEELIALFTSVRSTSRESAETIATGFRTIFGRLQRPKTIEYFKQLGIQLETAEGQFVGPYEAIKRINAGLEQLGIRAGSIKFAEVVEQIGGIRQISKVTPLLMEFGKAQKALAIANNGAVESVEDLEKAQAGLGYQLGVLQKEFGVLISDIVNSSSFKFLADVFINTSRAVIGLVGALKPLMPFLAALAAFKLSSGLTKLLSGGKGSGGGLKSALGFASGGLVPGSGNRDTVPAMLTPGEFVIRKSSVNKLGVANLARANKYASGGTVEDIAKSGKEPSNLISQAMADKSYFVKPSATIFNKREHRFNLKDKVTADIQEEPIDLANDLDKNERSRKSVKELLEKYYEWEDDPKSRGKGFEAVLEALGYYEKNEIKNARLDGVSGNLPAELKSYTAEKITPVSILRKALGAAIDGEGNAGKIVQAALTGANLDGGQNKINLGTIKLFTDDTPENAKRLAEEKNIGGFISKFAFGGGVGTDTVPALLTPGEFVINKASAQKIGAANLNRMNKVGKYAKGGFVGVQRFEEGGEVEQSTTSGDWQKKQKDLEDEIAKLTDEISKERDTQKEATEAALKAHAEFQQAQQNLSELMSGGASADQIAQAQGEVDSKKAERDSAGEKARSSKLSAEEKQRDINMKRVNIEYAKSKEEIAKFTESVEKSSSNLIAFGLQAQGVASGLKAFAGMNINQSALTAGQVKAGQLGTAAGMVGKYADPKAVQQFANQLGKVGNMLGKGSLGAPLRNAAAAIAKNAGNVAKAAGTLSKGLNVLGMIEIGGGLFDAIFSEDYGKQKDNFIAMGDAAGAGEAALREYNQGFLRSIPIIGGFLSGLASMTGLIDAMPTSATAKAAVETAKLAATINSADGEMKKATQSFKDAQMLGDKDAQRAAYGQQLDVISGLDAQKQDTIKATQGAESAAGGKILGNTLMGAAGGAATGAALGALLAPFTGGLSVLVGGIAGAVIGGAAAWWAASSQSKKIITAGYETATEAVKKGSEMQVEMINGFSNQLASETKRMIRAGGTYQDAVKQLTEDLGAGNVERLLDGRQLSGNAEADIQDINAVNAKKEQQIQLLEQEKAALKESDTVGRAKLDYEIASIQADVDKAEALKQGLVQAKAIEQQELRLKKEREIAARAMEYSIKLERERNKVFDEINKNFRSMDRQREAMENIGTGKMTSEESLNRSREMYNVDIDLDTLQMSSDEILRDDKAYAQMQNSVGRSSSMLAGELNMAKNRTNYFDQLDKMDKNKLSKLTKENKETSGEDPQTAAKNLMDDLARELNISADQLENDPTLKAALLNYSDSLIKNQEDTAKASEEGRKTATEGAKKIIDERLAAEKKFIEDEKKFNQDRIELSKRLIDIANATFDAEKEYFEKRMSLTREVEDFLNPIEEGPGKAQKMERRRLRRYQTDIGAMQDRRTELFTSNGVGLKSKDVEGALGEIAENANKLNGELNKSGPQFQQFNARVDAVVKSIQDEVSIRENNLKGIMEEAKARQEHAQALNDAQGKIVEDLVTASDDEAVDIMKTMQASQIAAVQGNFAGIPDEYKKGAMALYDDFGDVTIPGLGMSGKQAKKEVIKGEMMRKYGVDENTARQLADKAVKKQEPIEDKMARALENEQKEIQALYAAENEAKKAIIDLDQKAADKMMEAVIQFAASVELQRATLYAPKPEQDAEAQKNAAGDKADKAGDIQTLPDAGAKASDTQAAVNAGAKAGDTQAAADVQQAAKTAEPLPAQISEDLDSIIRSNLGDIPGLRKVMEANSGFFGSGIKYSTAQTGIRDRMNIVSNELGKSNIPAAKIHSELMRRYGVDDKTAITLAQKVDPTYMATQVAEPPKPKGSNIVSDRGSSTRSKADKTSRQASEAGPQMPLMSLDELYAADKTGRQEFEAKLASVGLGAKTNMPPIFGEVQKTLSAGPQDFGDDGLDAEIAKLYAADMAGRQDFNLVRGKIKDGLAGSNMGVTPQMPLMPLDELFAADMAGRQDFNALMRDQFKVPQMPLMSLDELYRADEAGVQEFRDKMKSFGFGGAASTPTPLPVAPTVAPPQQKGTNVISGRVDSQTRNKPAGSTPSEDRPVDLNVTGQQNMVIAIPQFENISKEFNIAMIDSVSKHLEQMAREIEVAQNFDDIARIFRDNSTLTATATAGGKK